METKQGREIEELKRRGYDISRVHCVNNNAAELATLNRRLDVRFVPHGVELNQAVREMHKAGARFDVINIDHTQTLNGQVRTDLMLAGELLKPGGVIGVTVARGHDDDVMRSLPMMANPDHGRIVGLQSRSTGLAYTRLDAYRITGIAKLIGACVYRNPEDGQLADVCRRHIGKFKTNIYRSKGASISMLRFMAQTHPHDHSAVNRIVDFANERKMTIRSAAKELQTYGPSVPVCVDQVADQGYCLDA